VIGKHVYRVGSIEIVDDGRNLTMTKTHTRTEQFVVESADREDFLKCVLLAVDRREDLATRIP
jgi:hypothetical protein